MRKNKSSRGGRRAKIHRKKSVLILAGLILLVLGGYFALRAGYDTFMKRMYPLKYSEIISQEAEKDGLDPALVFSVVKAESGFDPDAKSSAGAIGLMQLTPDTFEWLQSLQTQDTSYQEEDLYTPEINIRYGCGFLALLIEKYGSVRTALCAYNAGIGTVNGWLKDPEVSRDGTNLDTIPYGETEKYVDTVLDNYRNYQKIYQF